MVTLISSAIATDEMWKGHESAIIKLYNMLALGTFIRGLGEPLSLFCKNSIFQNSHFSPTKILGVAAVQQSIYSVAVDSTTEVSVGCGNSQYAAEFAVGSVYIRAWTYVQQV